MSAFFYGYVCSQLVGAHMCTTHGAVFVLQWAMLVWSLATLATPYATSISVAVTIICKDSETTHAPYYTHTCVHACMRALAKTEPITHRRRHTTTTHPPSTPPISPNDNLPSSRFILSS